MGSETPLKKSIMDYLNAVPGVHMVRIHTGGYRARVHGAPKGTSDLVGNVFMRACYLEVKVPGAKTDKKREELQKAFLAARRQEGAIAEVVESRDQALRACGLIT